jgi:hypothetical protein
MNPAFVSTLLTAGSILVSNTLFMWQQRLRLGTSSTTTLLDAHDIFSGQQFLVTAANSGERPYLTGMMADVDGYV